MIHQPGPSNRLKIYPATQPLQAPQALSKTRRKGGTQRTQKTISGTPRCTIERLGDVLISLFVIARVALLMIGKMISNKICIMAGAAILGFHVVYVLLACIVAYIMYGCPCVEDVDEEEDEREDEMKTSSIKETAR